MRKQPLILSPSYDVNASAVCWGLERHGLRPVWPHSASLADDAIGTVSVQSVGGAPWQFQDGLDGSRFASIWHRWPRLRTEFSAVQPGDLAFVQTEWQLFQTNVLALHDVLQDTFWINTPDASRRAENKLVQLHHAAACGMRFPATLVSNDPARIRRFIAGQSRTIYKPFRPHAWRDSESGAVFDTPAGIIEGSDDLKDEALALCPGIYQAYVDKTCDLRVTVIGDRIFTVRIDDGSGGAFVDWRPVAEDGVRAQACTLPAALEAKIKDLMVRLGLVYGAIDMVVDRDGEAHFLEVNQVGQFLFVEDWIASLPLLRAMCAMLAEGRPDYSLDTCKDVDFRAYLASESYARWQEQCWLPRLTDEAIAAAASEDTAPKRAPDAMLRPAGAAAGQADAMADEGIEQRSHSAHAA